MNITTTQAAALAIVALVAYHLGQRRAAPARPITTSTGGPGVGQSAGPEWWSYAGSWQ